MRLDDLHRRLECNTGFQVAANPPRGRWSARQAPRAATIKLDGVDVIWKRGTPREWRILLLMFFDCLYVRTGRIDHYVARADRADKVEALIRFATGGHPEVEVMTTVPRPGRPSLVAKCGKGGRAS